MVDESRRQRVELEVAHTVCPYDHGRLLLMESVDNPLERVFRRVEVVAVELHGKPSAPFVDDGDVPAPSYSQVLSFRYDVYEPRVVVLFQQGGGAVGGMVVHHDDIVFEVGLLSQCLVHGVADGLLPIEDRDDHCCLMVKACSLKSGDL